MANKKKLKVVTQDNTTDTFTGSNVSQLYVDTEKNNKLADEQAAQAALKEPTLGQGMEAAWDSETTTSALFSWLATPNHVPDPNFRIKDWAAASEGINPEYHGALLAATSEGELQDKRSRILKEQQDRGTLSRMGGTGIGLSLGAAILDPVGMALAAATGPLGTSAKATRIANVFRGGMAAASSNMALEGYLATQQETRDPEDIGWAGLIGFGFGNIAGLMSKHSASRMTETANDLNEAINLDKVKRDAESNPEVKLTPEGEARYQDLTNPVKAKVVTPTVAPVVAPAVPVADEVAPLVDDMELSLRDDIGDTLEEQLSVSINKPQIDSSASQIAPGSTQSIPDSLPPHKDPSVQPDVSTPVYKQGDDIIVETFDGVTVAGRVRSYDPDTGKMVILDDTTGKPKTVNLNEDEVTDVFDFSGSVGSAQIAGAKIDKTTEAAFVEARIPGTNYKVPLRFDYYSIFARSKNAPLREASEKLLSNSTGNKYHDPRDLNASEIAVLEQNTQKGRYISAADEAYAAKVKEMGWNWFEARKNRRAFNEAVTSAVRGNSTNQFADPHVGPVVAVIQKINNEMLEKMRKHGVEGAEDVDPNPFYMMRRFNHEKILHLKSRFSKESLQELIAKSIRAVRPVDDVQAKRIAKQYYNIVKAIPYEDMGRMNMGDAGRARLRMVAENEGVDEDLIDEIIDMVLAKPDGAKKEGDSPRLKHRTLMDEEYTTTLKGLDGQDYEVSMKDFFENDSDVLLELYTRQAGGLIGLAKVGIRSEADWSKIKREAAKAAEEAGEDPARHAKELKYMEDVYSNILGRPMSGEIYGKQERILKGLRDLNFIRLMGQVGVAQVAELAATLASAGTRAMALHMPAFKDIIKMGKLGQIDDDLQRDLLNMAGFGAEMRSQQALGRDMDDVFHDPRLSKLENGLNEGRKGIAMISGLAPMTNIMRQMTARMFTQKVLDFATGHAKLTDAKKKRLAWMGIGDDNIDAVFKDMRTYMNTNNPKDSKLEGIEWERWEKESPDTYMTFRMAIWRESRRIAQESTIGETMPLMHSQLGKVMLQFRGFMLVGHAKNMLNALHHRDTEAATVFLASMLGTSLAYIAQTSINYAGDEEKLKEKLAVDRIALAAFQRTGFSTLIPAVTDFGMQAAGHKGIFRDGRVSGQATALVTGNPTYDLVVNKAGGTAKNLLQNVTTDDYQATQKDIKNAMSIVLPNVFGVRNFINEVASGYPTYNDQRDYARQ